MRYSLFFVFIVLFMLGCSSTQEECTTVNSCAVSIKNRIQQNLMVEKDYIGKQAVVNLSLDNNSTLEYIEVVENDGGYEFENAIIKAISEAFPYEELLNLSESEYTEVRKIKLTVMPQ